MPNELTTTTGQVAADVMEQVIATGDLSKLTPAQRVAYYRAVCESLNLNPLTKPFEYITLNGKLTLYARKDAADQLRKQHGVSIGKPDIDYQDEWIVVTVLATDATGRTDSDIGVVSKKDMRGDFGNALMKAVTKAKRRVTLSICGLGMLDETEVETIPTARPVQVDVVTGEVVESKPTLTVTVTTPPAQGNDGNGGTQAKPRADWTQNHAEREAFRVWRERLTLSDTECKRMAAAYEGKAEPLAYFKEFNGTRLELQNAIEAQMAREQAMGEPEPEALQM